MLAIWDYNTNSVIAQFGDLAGLIAWLEEKFEIAMGETREQFGVTCAFDFAGDEGITTGEYIATYGNPMDDDGYWGPLALQHLSLDAGTVRGYEMRIHNVFK